MKNNCTTKCMDLFKEKENTVEDCGWSTYIVSFFVILNIICPLFSVCFRLSSPKKCLFFYIENKNLNQA